MDGWSGGLIIPRKHMKCKNNYPIQWVRTDGKPRMLSSENVGNIHFTKIDCGQLLSRR